MKMSTFCHTRAQIFNMPMVEVVPVDDDNVTCYVEFTKWNAAAKGYK